MNQQKTHHLYRAMLCIIIFFITILSSHQQIDESVEFIIAVSDQLGDLAHVCLLSCVPIYLAVIIFGFGIASAYCAAKIDHFFDQ